MGLNRTKAGSVYPPFTYDVSRAKIHEYATALGESDPRYHSDGDDCVAPPTFAACFTLGRGVETVLRDPELGAHSSLVHGGQRYLYGDRPLRPGDRLTCTPRLGDITARGGSEFLVLEVDCRFAGTDELAVLSQSTIVFFGPSGPSDASVADPSVIG